MRLCFLKPFDLPVPDNVTVVENYGEETVMVNGKAVAEGTVVYVKAEPEAIMDWLGGQEIWVGNGMMGFNKELVRKG